MVYKRESWIAAFTKAVADLKAKPTAGLPCAIATIRYIRDGLADDVGQNSDEASAIRDGCNELIQALQAPKLDLFGFGCNASAAGKAAGLKDETFAEFVKE